MTAAAVGRAPHSSLGGPFYKSQALSSAAWPVSFCPTCMWMLHYTAALDGDIRHTLLARAIPSHVAKPEVSCSKYIESAYVHTCGQYSQSRGILSADAA